VGDDLTWIVIDPSLGICSWAESLGGLEEEVARNVAYVADTFVPAPWTAHDRHAQGVAASFETRVAVATVPR